MPNKEKRILFNFDKLNAGKETEASKAGKTVKGDTKKSEKKKKDVDKNQRAEKKKPVFIKVKK